MTDRSRSTTLGPCPSDADLRRALALFYARVRVDDGLGPLFAGITDEAWPAHLQRIHDFWTSVVAGSGRYKGNPFAAHVDRGIEEHHFRRWLALFEEAMAASLAPHEAAVLVERAHRIADSLRAGLLFSAKARAQRSGEGSP